MIPTATGPFHLTRRSLIASGVATTAFVAAPAFAQEQQTPVPPVEAEPAPAPLPEEFSFDILSDQMRLAATRPFEQPERPVGVLAELQYDDYRNINFRADRSRWTENAASMFRVAAFHMGWLFEDPVRMFEVQGGNATEMQFSTDDFEYYNDLAQRMPQHAELPGVAGFRLATPINRPDIYDELVAFLGASYFRALGRGSAYGLSARGLAVNTATNSPEEFPRFSRFYIERPADGSMTVTIFAAMESPSVTGAYRFVITPGAETVMNVTARMYCRQTIAQLGVAPLTSMFLFAEKNRADFDDFRPNVHDSDGLRIERANGEIIWRPLNNPPQLSGSYFSEESPRSFGLYQRDREFENYQDTEARYERRPSLKVEPIGTWGKGAVRLVEIPTDSEINDNIVAFWVPEGEFRQGDAREYAYSLRWGDLPQDETAPLAWVFETRAGVGGVSGVDNGENFRKFVVDFKGGVIANLPSDAQLEAIVSVQNGEVAHTTLDRIPGTDMWRLVADVTAAEGAIVELGAHIAGYGRKLSETWLNQWINA
ncbi:glucan biosynthesis protein G [Cereibacter sp. SYSU M97828]|nr:glucan biosynthesis protein G [Cereibacter flavus]